MQIFHNYTKCAGGSASETCVLFGKNIMIYFARMELGF